MACLKDCGLKLLSQYCSEWHNSLFCQTDNLVVVSLKAERLQPNSPLKECTYDGGGGGGGSGGGGDNDDDNDNDNDNDDDTGFSLACLLEQATK